MRLTSILTLFVFAIVSVFILSRICQGSTRYINIERRVWLQLETDQERFLIALSAINTRIWILYVQSYLDDFLTHIRETASAMEHQVEILKRRDRFVQEQQERLGIF